MHIATTKDYKIYFNFINSSRFLDNVPKRFEIKLSTKLIKKSLFKINCSNPNRS